MFDSKIQEAYRRIKPSDALRARVLATTPAPKTAKVLNLRRIGNLAACFAAVLVIAMLATGLLSDPYQVVLADGTLLGHEARTVEPETAYYTATVPYALAEGVARTQPELTAAENCLHLTLHSPKIATVNVEGGEILLYDGELDAYTAQGSVTYCEGECLLWWQLPTLADGESCVMTVCGKECTRIEVRYCDGAYTATLIPQD